MHHSLRLYGQNQHRLIHLYMDLAKLSRIPVIGTVYRWAANLYARLGHAGYYLSLSDAEQIIDASDSISLGPCSCREEFKNCSHPVMSEIVLGKGRREVYASRSKEFRQISREEAKNVLQQAHKNHLTLSIMRCGNNFYAICNCCSCCCVPSRLKNQFGVGLALIRNKNVVNDFRKQNLR
ncbi:MAG TPA: ferredoxin-like protein [Dehalococcoidales bacterium]|nr:ferredoxin-like protein [Dehalococcoidales bacterium]